MEKKIAIKVINEVLNHLGMNAKQLSDSLGKNRPQWIYDILNPNKENVGISKNTASLICEKYPHFNESYLLTGEGNMLKNETPPKDERKNATAQADLVPLIPISAHGGSLDGFTSGVMPYECEMVTSPIKGADMAINVTGESMAPEYPNGCIVFAKRIYEAKFIEWGRVYVLDTVNGVVIKILTPSDKENCVKCVSINKDPIYAPFEVNLEDVNGIYRVLLEMDMK